MKIVNKTTFEHGVPPGFTRCGLKRIRRLTRLKRLTRLRGLKRLNRQKSSAGSNSKWIQVTIMWLLSISMAFSWCWFDKNRTFFTIVFGPLNIYPSFFGQNFGLKFFMLKIIRNDFRQKKNLVQNLSKKWEVKMSDHFFDISRTKNCFWSKNIFEQIRWFPA